MENKLILTLDHKYIDGNITRPGVNEILKAEGFVKYFNNDEFYLKRGEYIHLACALLDRGKLDWKSLSDELKPYVLGYQKFISDYNIKYLQTEIEVLMSSKIWNFAGSPDRLPKLIKNKETLIDIKTGDYQKHYELTTAAYQILCEENKYKVKQRWIVQLTQDANYKIIPCEDKKSRSVFLAAVLSFHWKKENL